MTTTYLPQRIGQKVVFSQQGVNKRTEFKEKTEKSIGQQKQHLRR